jgi:hypothetical protein
MLRGFFMHTLLDLRDKSADLCWQANADIIGPTAVDFSMIEHVGLPASEQCQLKRWASQDLADHYRAQRSNKFR